MKSVFTKTLLLLALSSLSNNIQGFYGTAAGLASAGLGQVIGWRVFDRVIEDKKGFKAAIKESPALFATATVTATALAGVGAALLFQSHPPLTASLLLLAELYLTCEITLNTPYYGLPGAPLYRKQKRGTFLDKAFGGRKASRDYYITWFRIPNKNPIIIF